MRTSKLVAVAAAVCGMSLLGMGSAVAAPVEAPAPVAPVQAAPASPISVDKPVVASGDTVTITVHHGPEHVSTVASDAFGGERDPFDPNRGVAKLVADENGVATYQAVIDAPAGNYAVDARIGGGNAPNATLTVR